MSRAIYHAKPFADSNMGTVFWIALFFVYLCVEVSFNSYLLDVATDIASDSSDFKAAELFGRTISSIGVCVFTFKFFRKKTKSLEAAGIALILVWCASFYGQKLFINMAVSNSTPSDRQAAFQYTSLVKLSNVVPQLSVHGTKSKSMDAILASLIFFGYADESKVENALVGLEKYKEVGTQAVNGYVFKEELYTNFLEMHQSLHNLYHLYNQVEMYHSNHINKQAKQLWEDIKGIHAGMVEAKSGLKSGSASILGLRRRGVGLSRLVKSASAKLWGCKERLLAFKYKQSVKSHAVLKQSTLCDWVDADMRYPPDYNEDKEYYHEKFSQIALKYKLQEQGLKFETVFSKAIKMRGYQNLIKRSYGLDCYHESILTQTKLAKALFQCEVLEGSEGYRVKEMLKMKRGLVFSRFISDATIVRMVSTHHGSLVDTSKYQKPDTDYFNKYALPYLSAEISKDWRKALFAPEGKFELNGQYYKEGAESYRYLIAIPLALLLSLLFIVISFIRLVVMSMSCVCGGLSTTIAALALGVVLFYPPAISSNEVGILKVTSSEGAFLSWVSRLEPVVYYIGRSTR